MIPLVVLVTLVGFVLVTLFERRSGTLASLCLLALVAALLLHGCAR
jgi:hypothetical protein